MFNKTIIIPSFQKELILLLTLVILCAACKQKKDRSYTAEKGDIHTSAAVDSAHPMAHEVGRNI